MHTSLRRGRGHCLSAPGAVVNLFGAADRHAGNLTDR